jgi:hypothetical protein
MKRARIVTTLALLALLSACNPSSSPEAEALLKEMNRAVESVKGSLGTNELDSLASQEVEKLFVFEYNVVELPSGQSTEQLNEQLSELGKERWDCFHVEEKETQIRLFCKRRPKTYLRYIPRVF